MNDGPTAADRPGSDATAGLDPGLADELRRAVEARVAAPAAGPGPDVAAIVDLAAARRRRRTAGRAVLAAAATVAVLAGVVVGWRMLGGKPGGDVLVVAGAGEQAEDTAASSGADPDAAGGGEAAPTAAAPTAAAPTAAAPTAAAPTASAPTAAAPTAAGGAVDESPLSVTPEELSTGPALDWTETQTGFWDLWGLRPLGDGRVLAYASRNTAQLPQIDAREVTVVTSDGVHWSEVELPAEVTAHHVAASGDLWVVAGFGWPAAPLSDANSRVFVSKDGAATWRELELDTAPSPAPVSPWVAYRTVVAWALVSGQDIVLAIGVSADLDVAGLAEARGLLPEDRAAAGWSFDAEGFNGEARDGEVSVLLTDSAAVEQAAPAVPEDGADASGGGTGGGGLGAVGARSGEEADAPDFATGETLQFTLDELGLTAEEEEALFGEPNSLLLVWSDGDTVGEAVEAAGARGTLGVWGAATGDGFVIHLVGSSRGSILTSPDGRTWIQHSFDTTGLFNAVGYRGSVWAAVDEPSGTSLKRVVPGDEPRTVTGFEGLRVVQLHAGPAGLAATAAPLPEAGAHTGPDLDLPRPELRISRDGYELRYDEPPGGMTLWDVGAGEAVRVFEAEELDGDEPIAGVREDARESGIWVTFTDPGTGEDLVTFEPKDFAAALDAMMSEFDALMSEGLLASGADPASEAGTGSLKQDEWVGWSSDGVSWGWHTTTGTFGVDAGEAWIELGVGRDFVVAAVQPLGTPPVPAPDGSGALVAVPEPVRVFMAPAP